MPRLCLSLLGSFRATLDGPPITGRRIADAAATLPPDVVAVAQGRGWARDLWTMAEAHLAELSDGNL